MRSRAQPQNLRRPRARALVAACVVLAVGSAVGQLAAATGVTARAEQQTLDWRWELRGERNEDPRIAMVAIDDESLHRLGATWPIARSLHARTFRALTLLGVAQVVYNVEFDLAGPGREDDALLEAIGNAPSVVLPTTTVDAYGPRFLGGGAANRSQTDAWFGGDIELRDDDGAIRRFRTYDTPLGRMSLPMAAATRVLGHPPPAPSSKPWIDLPAAPCRLGGPSTRTGRLPCPVPTYTLRSILDGAVPGQALSGRIAVVGPTGANQQVLRRSYAGGDGLVTSTELLAHQIGTALRGFPLRNAPSWWTYAAALLLAGVPAAMASAIRLRLAAHVAAPSWATSAALVSSAGMVAAVSWFLVASFAFDRGRVVEVAWPVVAIGVTSALAASTTGALARRRSAEVWRTAAALAPSQIIEQVVTQTQGRSVVGGAPVEMTILFADVRDSTRYVLELNDPTKTWRFSQAFMRHAIAAIHDRGGYAQSLEGDGIVAMFGPNYGGDDHAYLAVRAALDLVGPALDAIRADLLHHLSEELGGLLVERPLGLRVAVHSGRVQLGTSGMADARTTRLATSTVGVTTHLAARLRATASPSKKHQWDPAAADLLFGPDHLADEDEEIRRRRELSDERIVVVSDVAMMAAQGRRRVRGAPWPGFVATWVRPIEHAAPIDVWIHQGPPLDGHGEPSVPASRTPLEDESDGTGIPTGTTPP